MSHYSDMDEQAPKTTRKPRTKKAEPKNKGGRPRYEVDYETLDKLCGIQCTGEECAAILKVDYDTLDRALKRDKKGGFTEYFAQKGAFGKMSLRRKQYDQAMTGNSTMLVWLGKQWLGQTDRVEETKKGGDDLASSLSKLIDKLPN